MNSPSLNSGQEAAAEGVFRFLLSRDTELCISGGGGVGKTFLMGRLVDEVIPRYFDICSLMNISPIYREVHMTATTNKAAEVLGNSTKRPAQTAQSLLGLRVQDDYKTGKSRLVKSSSWVPLHNKIFFVDESSMVDITLRKILLETAVNSKIIYVGDHCQLAPVGETMSSIYQDNLPFFELTEPMRNAGQPALMAVCNQLRETVKTGVFKPIKIVPGVIDYMDPQQMEQEIYHIFLNPSNQDRILCYRNDKVIQLNNYIRSMRGMPPELTVGEFVVNNSAIVNRRMTLRVEDQFQVTEIGPVVENEIDGRVRLKVRLCTLDGKHGIFSDVPVPVDQHYFNELLTHYRQKKDWVIFYELKNNYPDLRPHDASTVYKAQGSTLNTTVIDLNDLSSCSDPDTVARMLYVAFSRARNRIILYGKLAKKYGGLTR